MWKDITAARDEVGAKTAADLRKEFRLDNRTGVPLAVLGLPVALLAVLIAFGRPSKWSQPTMPLAPGRLPPESPLPPPPTQTQPI